ncbi:hypothetical protein [Arthrobacter sp. 2MCAF14]|uniref:hypothetical protein n=1 Tax=Arthrobacter sp. 2MCAF14 TaxID=3232982 RepID=UPI003F91399C
MRALERLTFHVQDITDVLASVIWEEDAGTVIPAGVPPNMAEALEEVATAIRQWRHGNSEDFRNALDEARNSVAALTDTVTEAAAGQESVNATASVAMSLRRIITVVSDAA